MGSSTKSSLGGPGGLSKVCVWAVQGVFLGEGQFLAEKGGGCSSLDAVYVSVCFYHQMLHHLRLKPACGISRHTCVCLDPQVTFAVESHPHETGSSPGQSQPPSPLRPPPVEAGHASQVGLLVNC